MYENCVSGYDGARTVNIFDKWKLRFRWSFWDVEWIYTSIASKVMKQKAFFPFPFFCNFVKKNRENVAIDFFSIHHGRVKKTLRIATLEFCKLNLNKGQKFTDGTGLQSKGLVWFDELKWNKKNLTIKMFDKLKGRIHPSNQKKKTFDFEVLKYWNEFYESFGIQSCQKIEYNALFIMKFSPVANFGDQSLIRFYHF